LFAQQRGGVPWKGNMKNKISALDVKSEFRAMRVVYGSEAAILDTLHLYPGFKKLNRVTIYDWMTKGPSERTEARILHALKILKTESSKKALPLSRRRRYIERFQQIYIQLAEIRRTMLALKREHLRN